MFFHQVDNSQGNYTYASHIYRAPHWGPHFHKNYEAIHVFSGCLEMIIDGRRVILKPGDFAMCLSNQVHHFMMVGECRFWIGVFSGDHVPEFDKEVQSKVGATCSFRCTGSVMDFLSEHIMLGHSKPLPDFHRRVAGLNLICSEYLKNVQLVPRENTEYALMNDISDYIYHNFRTKLTLKDVAVALGYDYYYFSRLFRRIFGMRFVDYLNACRFSAAVDALRSTDNSITSIALDSGFQSIRSFNDVFLKNMGMSPAQYRKQVNSQQ